MADLKHIEIMKEDVVKPYRFRSNPMAPKPINRNRSTHGKKLAEELSQTTEFIESKRVQLGIDSKNLLVLEIISDAMSKDILENMLIKFKLFLVEEEIIDPAKPNKSKLVIQFEDKAALDLFNKERELWQNNDPNNAILTCAQRRDLFNCIENIRMVSREDRIGPRLKKYFENPSLFPKDFFIVNIDVWYNGDRSKIIETENIIRKALGTQGSALLGDLFEIPSLLLGRAQVNEFTLNALLDLDIISLVDLPLSTVSTEQYELYSFDFEPIIHDNLGENAPLAAVLDSGIFSANPLLSNVIVGEEEFDTTENTTSDLNGHGTGVAGIVVYGDFNKCIESKVFTPLVRILNGKIMHNENGDTCFPADKRPEQIVKEAIEYFHKEYNCRVFNLSTGDMDHLYNGGRQFAWAEMLDQLSRNLDIVIIVSAGNVPNPVINEFDSREALMKNCRNQLFQHEHRLIDPATSALSVTVGSITRFAEPEVTQNRGVRLSVGAENYPSVFTRIGRGVNKAIKPELVDYGGNYALHQIARGNTRWHKNDRNLLEPTLNNGNDRIFKGYCGTSFSAPHVTHIVARIERALEEQIGERPSANLIRALLVNSAKCTPEMVEWTEESIDALYSGKGNPRQERRLRLIGFGKADDSILYSNERQVTLFAEDELDLRSFHLYKIPVPKEFLSVHAEKRIVVSLAYNPITRLSRKDYLACNLWFEIFRKMDEETLLKYKAKKETGEDTEDDLKNLPDSYKMASYPGYTEIFKSTLQQRVWAKSARGGRDLLWNDNNPYIYILVTGKEQFKYAEQDSPQPYALVITFSYSGQEDIKLYEKLQSNVRIRDRQRERARVQIKA
ncbi:hypothetical protein JOC37_000557 [Desulfohalotomaculum tongense]|uniref:S8 family peptidase n=1 Tax=Desulforadius tongensis TaxID=1216062 RepID=UPI00195DA228|nr:S8 family peptidase [Desulforadius tongensis]MBM7854185.1 hypothetical protein [Desulforadius tongensis]